MRAVNKITPKCILILILTLGFGSHPRAEVNYDLFKMNSFLWGQTVGCFIRLETYAEVTASANVATNSDINRIISDQLSVLIGDISGFKESMFDKRAFDPSFLMSTREDYEQFIRDFALEEWKNGTAWLQAMGCTKMINAYGFGK